MNSRKPVTVPDQKLTTKRGQDAWVKKAVATGMDEASARALVVKMVLAQEGGSEIKSVKPSAALNRAKVKAPNSDGGFFADMPLPPAQTVQSVSTRPPLLPQLKSLDEMLQQSDNAWWESWQAATKPKPTPKP